ncbi:MAG: FG-GAP-like repeat-containing protein [Planctomycetota bacterium]
MRVCLMITFVLWSGMSATAGILLWQTPFAPAQQSPSMVSADIAGDSRHEIIVGCFSGIHVFSASGALLPGWPTTAPPPQPQNGVSGPVIPPRIGDINGDGQREFVYIEATHRRIVAMDFSGACLPGFPRAFPTTVWGTNPLEIYYLVLADSNGNGADEIFVLSGSSIMRVFGIDGLGQLLPSWPVALQPPPAPAGFGPWNDQFPAGLSAADIDGDGLQEVFCSYRMYASGSRFGVVWGIASDGTILPGWPQLPSDGGGAGALIFTDVEGDLQPDLLMTGDEKLQHFHVDGTWFPHNVTYSYNQAGGEHMAGNFGGVFRAIIEAGEIALIAVNSPGMPAPAATLRTSLLDEFSTYIGGSVGDVDGDGLQDLAIWSINSNASNGLYLHLLDHNLNQKPGWPKLFTPNISSTYAQWATLMVDLDGDGDSEIVHSYGDQLYAWDQPPIGSNPAPPLWPMETHGVAATWNQWQLLADYTEFLRGDSDGDNAVNLFDAVVSLEYLFLGGSVSCLEALDVDASQSVNVQDPVLLLSYLFLSGPPPQQPHPGCELVVVSASGPGCAQGSCP